MLWFEDGAHGGFWAGDDFVEGLLRNYSRISLLLPQYRGRTNNPRHLDRVRERRDPPTSFGAYLVIADPKGAQIGRGISPLAPLGRDDVAVVKKVGRDEILDGILLVRRK